MSEKLAENFKQVKSFPISVEAGKDDPNGVAHEFRFSRGYVGNSQELWLQARRRLGLSGISPISNYETVLIGINGLVSGKVWHKIHSPSSKELSIKLLMTSATKSAYNHSREKAAELKEFESIHELRMAVVALDNAIRKAMWWNFSFVPIAVFLQSIEFGSKDFEGRSDRLSSWRTSSTKSSGTMHRPGTRRGISCQTWR